MHLNAIHTRDLESLVKKIPQGVSPIIPADQILYKSYFSKSKHRGYACSWPYIIQACRNLGHLGYKYHFDHSLVSIGAHQNHYVVVCPLGLAFGALKTLLPTLKELSKKPVFIKHLNPNGISELNLVSMSEFPWHPNHPHDDSTFPEPIIDLNLLAKQGIRGPKFSKLRLRINRFRNAYGDYPLQFIPYDPEYFPQHQKQAKKVILKWSAPDRHRLEVYSNLLGCPDNQGLNYLLKLGKQICGVFIAGIIDSKTAGVYANICDWQQYPGLSEMALYQFLMLMFHQHGIERCNLGGSETYALHKFKLKFQPSELKHRQHLVYL